MHKGWAILTCTTAFQTVNVTADTASSCSQPFATFPPFSTSRHNLSSGVTLNAFVALRVESKRCNNGKRYSNIWTN
ncbi:Hypothetical protein NTJ_14879 [Nesidiocoris tenuis]|uniref:Secreted protein n=1 Tax=Nesidiocoris tenuis TaxID=355587 RepID=A0ABN7BEI4_9HEMI|nr:Hypothetical protein NTJ_14879 [Nesidiocoris tenuis]